jgi:hypothetical protein
MKRLILPLVLTLTLILAACAPSQASTDSPPGTSQTNPQAAAPISTDASQADTGDWTRSDAQGSVTVNVTPLNLENPSDQLEFDIALETHSVDLSMDLATLATLTTDTGITVQATTWDAPRGGHHVEGKLIFPATKDGKTILEDASKLTLTITDVDAPSRVFEWPVP